MHIYLVCAKCREIACLILIKLSWLRRNFSSPIINATRYLIANRGSYDFNKSGWIKIFRIIRYPNLICSCSLCSTRSTSQRTRPNPAIYLGFSNRQALSARSTFDLFSLFMGKVYNITSAEYCLIVSPIALGSPRSPPVGSCNLWYMSLFEFSRCDFAKCEEARCVTSVSLEHDNPLFTSYAKSVRLLVSNICSVKIR